MVICYSGSLALLEVFKAALELIEDGAGMFCATSQYEGTDDIG